MITLNLRSYGKIRIYFKKHDIVRLTNDVTVSRNYNVNDHSLTPLNHTLIAEVYLPRGARIIYGLLGVEYKNINSEEALKVTIRQNKNKKSLIEETLLSHHEPVLLGLEAEYSKHIFEAIETLNEKKALALGGVLDFCYGAHSEVSSNGWVFNKLTTILISLLQVPENKVNSDMIQNIIDS